MYRDILLPCFFGGLHMPALQAARALAVARNARLVALAGVSIVAPVPSAWAYYPAGVYATMHESAEATTLALVKTIGEQLAHGDGASDVIQSEQYWLTPAEQAIAHAYCADVTVLGIERRFQAHEDRLFAGLMMESGRPLLLVPAQSTADSFRRILVAWKPSREAARALHDALPVLEQAESVDLLMVEGSFRSPPMHNAGGAEIALHLRHHGIEVNPVRRNDAGTSTGLAIVDYAKEMRADMIVVGGYGRSRASEIVFGGVTQTLLRHATTPVLFSH
ncbi:universal stress protein [Lysobacter sp. S4-A87]|uniref:universal stress protein n=1 Tax=Lysobacter sp. S4-A87 TaxID=2925843 RepID=UPI001F537131|nr:universal stress protein [Lysobacter sp. S4-A87]UNK49826.1 universal stress protein [Lysobacter sp. S4-A87]